jgi:flagellar biosynthesis protein FlhF
VKLKSYYGASIKEALDRARRDLGADAAIVASRQVRPEERLPAAFEVVCGVPAAELPVNPEPVQQPQPEPERTAPPKPEVRSFRRLRKPVAAVREALSRTGAAEPDPLRVGLLADGFGEDLTAEILAGVKQRQRKLARENDATPEQLLACELASRIRTSPELGRSNEARRVVALVGPPGAGKTTTLVKLAVRYGLTGKRPMHIISTDAYRIGGTEALRAYAAAMGTSFECVETAAALAQSLNEHSGKGLILIDTQGLGPADMTSAAQLSALLSKHTEIDVHLVLPAWMDAAALESTIERFRPFLPSKLLATSVDAAPNCRKIVAQSLLWDKPVSFLGTGQIVPEDLQPATAERLTGISSAEANKAISAA